MGGASLQLALYGTADILLTGSPQVTFFKLVYRRCTPFAMEAMAQAFQGNPDFGRRTVCPLAKTGDLVTDVWLQITLPNLNEYRVNGEKAVTETATTPGIDTCRWASASTATVKVIAPTAATTTPASGESLYYVVTATDDAGGEPIEGASTSLTVELTGLVAGANYTVTARWENRDAEGNAGDAGEESESCDLISVKWCNSVGHAIVRSAELEIGGVRIDRHESDWLDILSELTLPEEKRDGFEYMVGKYPEYDLYGNSFAGSRTLFVPLMFFFNRTPALALPLVALAYHNCNLNFEFRDYTECIKSTVAVNSLLNAQGRTPSMDCQLYATYIFTDVDERRRFTSSQMEMLVEQTQFLGDVPIIADNTEPNLNRKLELSFSHPVKELIWTWSYSNHYNSGIATSSFATDGNDHFNYSLPDPIASEEPFADAKIQVNGQDRMQVRPGSYYRLVQPYTHHTRIPRKKIYNYSFALHPEEFTPTGSINFSRLDTAHLVVNLNPNMLEYATRGRIRVYATSFNLLRIASGMAGVVFSG